MTHHAYMINGRYVDAELFAQTISNLFAQGWVLAPPSVPLALVAQDVPEEVAEARHPEGGWGNVTAETRELN